LHAAEGAAEALAAPDPEFDAERGVIAEAVTAQTASAPVSEAEHRAAITAGLSTAMQRPPAWANVSLTPPPGAWCAVCRGRTWWTESCGIRRGWRCMVCRPPIHLRPEDVMERQT
jgi:hypothetical protein